MHYFVKVMQITNIHNAIYEVLPGLGTLWAVDIDWRPGFLHSQTNACTLQQWNYTSIMDSYFM